MQTEGFFEWLGHALGSVIRWIIDALGGFFETLASASGDFLAGLAQALGMTPSLLGLVALAIGLALLGLGARALLRRAFVSGLLLILFGLWLVSWLID